MLPSSIAFKTIFMISFRLSMIAVGMIACTHPSGNSTPLCKDNTLTKNTPQNTPVAPVVSSQAPENIAPELPIFKDVLDAKRLFW
jgi:hypothetical protein